MRISYWSSDVCSSDLDPNRQVREVVQFFLARPAEAGDVLVRNQRIAQRVVLVIIFKDGAREDGAFLHAQPLAQRTGRDIADDDFKRNDLHLPDKLLAHVETADDVGGHADAAEQPENMPRNPGVGHALAGNKSEKQ